MKLLIKYQQEIDRIFIQELVWKVGNEDTQKVSIVERYNGRSILL